MLLGWRDIFGSAFEVQRLQWAGRHVAVPLRRPRLPCLLQHEATRVRGAAQRPVLRNWAGIIYDETEGPGYFAELGRLNVPFTTFAPIRDRTGLTQLREYLSDDSVHPMVIRRLVARHPEGVDRAFRALLRKPTLRWEQDGEHLLRRHKKHFFDREPMPSIPLVGERLAQLLRAGR